MVFRQKKTLSQPLHQTKDAQRHTTAVLFSYTKSVPATSRPAVFLSHSKLAPVTSHSQPNRVDTSIGSGTVKYMLYMRYENVQCP